MMKRKISTVAIIGMGAIGKLLSYGILLSKNNCYFIDDRENSPDKVSFNAIHSSKQENITIHKLRKNCVPDIVILTTKTYQTKIAISKISTYIPKNIPFVILQNGMGNDEMVKSILPNPIFLASTTIGAFKEQDKVFHTGEGIVFYDNALDLSFLSTDLIPWKASSDINKQLLIKLAINSVINPITSLNNIKNGEILNILDNVYPLIHEIYCIIKYHIADITEDALRNIIINVAKATSNNYSSMHEDLKYGRQTEIESILGYLIKEAEKQNCCCQQITQLYKKIRAWE